MTDDSSLRRRVREAMQTGHLPDRFPDEVFGGSATGVGCAVCGEPTRGGLELELVFANGSAAGRRSYHLHPGCLPIFEGEIPAAPAEGSEAANAGYLKDAL